MYLIMNEFICSCQTVIGVDVIVTLECIHLYFLCIVTRCLLRDVFVMYLTHVMHRGSYREFL